MSCKILFLVFLLFGGFVVAGFYVEESRIRWYEERVAVLEQDVVSLNGEVAVLEERVWNLSSELVRAREELVRSRQRISVLEEENLNLRRVSSVRFAVVGVDNRGRGSVIPLYVTVKAGSGRVFLDVADILFDETLQASAQTAVMVARYHTRVDMSDKDVNIVIKPETEGVVYTIGGGSGGAAMTVAVIAALKGVNLSDEVLVTGTIRADGSIGRIGEVEVKAEAARDYGADLFLVPSGQNVSVSGISVREVKNIEQVLSYVMPSVG
jgi:hypothetical protein